MIPPYSHNQIIHLLENIVNLQDNTSMFRNTLK